MYLVNIFKYSVTMVLSSWGSPLSRAPPQTSPQQLPWKFRLKPRNTSQARIPALSSKSVSAGKGLFDAHDVEWHSGTVSSFWMVCLSAYKGLACNLSKWGRMVNGVIIDLKRGKGKKQTFLSAHMNHTSYSFNLSSPTSPCGSTLLSFAKGETEVRKG